MTAPLRINTWNTHLLELLEYRVVLGVLVTTLDGLVVAHAGIPVEDAEVLAAAASHAIGEGMHWDTSTSGGMVCIVNGTDMRLIALTEHGAFDDALGMLMTSHLARLEHAIAA